MAPRKEKTEKAPADQAAELILNYLRKQNRPYSATDISTNLHNKVTKTAAAKHLKDLHERKEIEGRASGKQIVYHCIQNPSEATNSEDILAFDKAIASASAETAASSITAKNLRTQLAALTNTLSTADLFGSLTTLEAEKAELLAHLTVLRGGNLESVDEREVLELERDLGKWSGIEARRRKIREDMWNLVRDGIPEGKSEAEVRESLCIDEED